MTNSSCSGQGTGSRPGRWRRSLTALLCAGAIAVLILTALPTLYYPLTRDQGAYAYIADLMVHGGVPYRDAWDLKPPAVYLLYALAFSLFGRSELAIRLFDVLHALLSAASLYVLAHEVFSERPIAALSAWLYPVCYFALFHFYSAANPEAFMIPLLVTTAWGMVRFVRTRGAWWLLLAGVASGLAFWFKPTAELVVAAMLVWTLLHSWSRSRSMAGMARQLTAFTAGGLLGLLPVGLFLNGRGLQELIALWQAYGTGAYLGARGLALADGPLAVLDVLAAYFREWQLLVWLTLAGSAAVLIQERHQQGKPRAVCTEPGSMLVVFLLASLAATLVQGKLFEYHWMPALAPAVVLSGVGAVSLAREVLLSPTSRWQADVRSIFAVVVIASLLLSVGYDHLPRYRYLLSYLTGRMSEDEYFSQFDIGTDFSRVGARQAAAYLRQHTSPQETVLIWGAEPLVNFLAERRSPTKYIFSYMLSDNGSDPHLEVRRQEFLDELRRSPPTYIVLVERDVTPLAPLGSRVQVDQFPAFRAVLETQYRFEGQVEDYVFYRRSGNEVLP